MKKSLLLCSLLAAATLSAQQLVTDLPAVYITTEGGAEITSTEVYTPATLTVVDIDDTPTVYADTKVRGRGNTLFSLAKKPYKLKLAKKARLGGPDGANGKKWNLMADHGDKTLLRNALASFIATQAGQPFAPVARFCDLTLNGSYCGTYRLTDQIDIRKKRVNITEQPEELTATTDITGGYLLEIDDSADDLEGSVFTTSRGVKITIKSPDEDVIAQKQIDYIAAHVQKFEDALFASNWLDPTQGYRKYLDLNSLVQWYITAELSAEPNSFRSVYFYKEKADDRLCFGPVWDFDFAFDNSSRWGCRPEALVAQEGRGKDWCYTWINRLRQDPAFHQAVNDAWTSLTSAGLINSCISYIDTTAASIEKSRQKNFTLYAIGERAHDEQHLFSTYEENVDFLKSTLRARAEFLTQAFATLAAGGTVPVTGAEDSIDQVATPDYNVFLANGQLHFASLSPLQGTYTIYNTTGALIQSGPITPAISVANLPSTTYILLWTVDGRTHTTKFQK